MQFKVACPSNVGSMCIHSMMTILCKTQIFHRLFEGSLSIAQFEGSRQVMEMHSSHRGDKHEFCLVVIKVKHFRSCPSMISHIHDCIVRSSSEMLSGGADICDCKSVANE